jgi:ribose/xylose/arabinose/galactoside ABC-type transport system permease subunit
MKNANNNRLAQLAWQNTPLLLFIVVFLIFGLLSPRFFALQSFETILKQASYIGIVAIGMTFVILTAGIDLSVGSNMYVSAAVAGLVMQNFKAPVWVGLLVCLAVGVIFGGVNAFLITKLKIIPFIATLGTLVAGKGVGLLFSRSIQIPFPDSVLELGSTRLFDLVPLPIVIFLSVAIIAHLVLTMTPTGRQIYAVGNDAEAAKKAGLNVGRVLATVYIVSGLMAALGGFVSVAQQGVVHPGFGEGYEFNAIAATVLGGASLFGGVGSVLPGTLLGAVLIQMIQTGLIFTKVDIYLQPLITAGIIFAAVLLDAFRNMQLQKMRRRNIRVEKGAASTAGAGD